MKVIPDQPPRPRPGEPPAPPEPSVRPLTPTEFNTAMVHLYRGEVGRANTWRTRLDGTTNWAVLTTGATLSFAFSSPNNTQVMILINTLLIFFFLYIEARRYRFYDLWRSRVRLMETEFFAEMLTPSTTSQDHRWRDLLAHDLLYPRFGITLWQALGRRLRRNYLWIFSVLVVSWVVKISIHPFATQSPDVLMQRIAIGPIPAWAVLLTGVVFNMFIIYLALSTRGRLEDEAPSRQDVRERVS
ncbi:MAG: DUF2270 domain-containing protein [Roseiflexaceae bacterium]